MKHGAVLSTKQWEMFKGDVLHVAELAYADVVFKGEGWAKYGGITEVSYTVVLDILSMEQYGYIRKNLALFALLYDQTSIALTDGPTEFVEPSK